MCWASEKATDFIFFCIFKLFIPSWASLKKTIELLWKTMEPKNKHALKNVLLSSLLDHGYSGSSYHCWHPVGGFFNCDILLFTEMGTRYFFRYPILDFPILQRQYPIPILWYFSKFGGPILDTPILYKYTKKCNFHEEKSKLRTKNKTKNYYFSSVWRH
jgi:hypothetical protein